MFLNDMNSLQANEISIKGSETLEQFMSGGISPNATLALRTVMAISLAERLGAQQGYQLLLAAVKSGLYFSFVNGVSSYSLYCL